MTSWRRHCNALALALVLCPGLHAQAHEQPACATTLGELKILLGGHSWPQRWEETSMRDGKPLVVSILERNGALLLEFVKTQEGLWAESRGVICRTGTGLEARFSADQVRLGPAANWLMRGLLGRGGHFTLTELGPEQLRIATSGWSGLFSPGAKAEAAIDR